jgi:hypothetical protein
LRQQEIIVNKFVVKGACICIGASVKSSRWACQPLRSTVNGMAIWECKKLALGLSATAIHGKWHGHLGNQRIHLR